MTDEPQQATKHMLTVTCENGKCGQFGEEVADLQVAEAEGRLVVTDESVDDGLCFACGERGKPRPEDIGLGHKQVVLPDGEDFYQEGS